MSSLLWLSATSGQLAVSRKRRTVSSMTTDDGALRRQLSDRWLLTLRRAFGVPDLVTDANAREAILLELLQYIAPERPMGGGVAVDVDQYASSQKILDRFLVMAAQGDMDGCLVVTGNSVEDAQETISLALAQAAGNETQTASAARYLLEKIVAEVKARPFGE